MKNELIEQGYTFSSDTDTEVVAVELSKEWSGDLLETVLNVAKKLEGTYALVVTTTRAVAGDQKRPTDPRYAPPNP